MNTFVLSVHVFEKKTIRYTPAGVPVLELVFSHDSEQFEAGQSRKVSLTIPAVALGNLAHEVDQLGLGAQCQATGFLAPRRKNTSSLVFHLQAIEMNTRTYVGLDAVVV